MFQSDLVARKVDTISIQNKVIYAWNTSVSEQRNNNFEKKPLISLSPDNLSVLLWQIFLFPAFFELSRVHIPKRKKKTSVKYMNLILYLFQHIFSYIESRLNKRHHMLIFFFFWKK